MDGPRDPKSSWNADSILITGLVRDSARNLCSEVSRLEEHAKKIFGRVSFYVVESDSSDNTLSVLRNLRNSKHNFEFTSLGNLSLSYPDRFTRLMFCRNRYVQFIRELSFLEKPKYIMVVDFDIKNNCLNLNPLQTLLTHSWWDGLFVNQRGRYYDILALRKKGWVEEDCFQEYHRLAKSLKREEAKEQAIWSKMIKIPRSSPIIEVKSAFGGLAIYRSKIFDKFDYSNELKGSRLESEHTSLHKKITNSGGKLFIVPEMTNFAYSPHNLSSFRLFRRVDRFLKLAFFRGFRRMFRRLLA